MPTLTLNLKVERVLNLFGIVMIAGFCAAVAAAQGPCGGKPCPVIKIAHRKTAPVRSTPPRGSRTTTGSRPPRVSPPGPVCEDAELVVVCGLPGCEITLNGTDRSVTDELGGITFEVEGSQSYRIKITKPGYETFEKREEKLGCGGEREVKAPLAAKPVALRIRTNPVQCDIYLDGQKQSSGSDAQGLFSYTLSRPTLLIEARRKGFLSATKNIFLKPELANSEISLQLDPISASVRLLLNIVDARVRIDDARVGAPTNDQIKLPPGPHTLIIEALGYTPAVLELTVAPDESVEREVRLERLQLPALQQQAVAAFNERRYADALKLCDYIFETDRANAIGHRLAGQVYLARGDFNNAGAHLSQALAGGEPVVLQVRRHAGEKFDLNRGHDACEARLILGKNEVEFQGKAGTDNFKVTYDQFQIIGIQLKNNVASYLGTKVNVGGKWHDFNFYSYDKELSQTGKPYLEMVQRLLLPH